MLNRSLGLSVNCIYSLLIGDLALLSLLTVKLSDCPTYSSDSFCKANGSGVFVSICYYFFMNLLIPLFLCFLSAIIYFRVSMSDLPYAGVRMLESTMSLFLSALKSLSLRIEFRFSLTCDKLYSSTSSPIYSSEMPLNFCYLGFSSIFRSCLLRGMYI